MILTRNKLILGISYFLLIVNLLALLDLEFFYIRAILVFVFLITVPGLLIMLCFKIRNIRFWEYLVYTVGLSVAFIMFAGLLVNWTLPFLNITDKPLSLYPVLISFDVILLFFLSIASKRNKDLNFKINFPEFSRLDGFFIIIPFTFPFLAVIGAFILNNHGPNYVSMALLGAIAVYVLLVVIFRDKLNKNVYPWALYMIGLSLLFSFSMRSWYISGSDTNSEYSVFQFTKQQNFWGVNNYDNAYNTMLSVSIFPTMLSLFLEITDFNIFKLMPLFYSVLPIIIYLTCKKYYSSEISYLGALFFISQPVFFNWFGVPIRQEIAFLFFGLMILVLFSKEINSQFKKIMFVIFGFSMIVSHYSTTYIALAIFLFSYILIFFYKKLENRKIKKGKIKEKDRQEFCLTIFPIVLLLIFGFLWYSQLTNLSDGLIDFMYKSFSRLGDIFNEDVQAKGQSPLKQFNVLYKPRDISKELNDYRIDAISRSSNSQPSSLYPSEWYKDYRIYPKSPSGNNYNFSYKTITILFSFRE